MKKLFLVANWKSNKNRQETETWMQQFAQSVAAVQLPEEKTVVIAPPYLAIPYLAEKFTSLPRQITLGVQDMSPFGEGAYTGEITAKNLEGFPVQYAIIGHSERRKYFNENDAVLAKKVEIALADGIIPIFCVPDAETAIPVGVTIVAYEPIASIGTGNPDTPENADAVTKQIKEKRNIPYVLYGGSVTAENVGTYTAMPHIDGVLVGGASLKAELFVQLVSNA